MYRIAYLTTTVRKKAPGESVKSLIVGMFREQIMAQSELGVFRNDKAACI